MRRAASVLTALLAVAATVLACTRLDVSALAAASPPWVAAALAINALAMLLRAFAWLGMLRRALPHEAIPASRVLRATMIGVLGSAVAPARAGEPLRAWLVARRIGRRDALATVTGTLISQTLLNLVALVVLAVLALPGRLPGHSVRLALAWPLTIAMAVLLSARVARRGGWAARQLQAVRGGLVVFRPARRGAAISALQLGAWALQTLAAYALLQALRISVTAPLATAAAILVAVNVTAAVPVTPSNIGVFQAACIAVLAGIGVASGVGLSYGLLLQGTELVTAIVLGLPAAGGELWTSSRAH